mmetsp:Transcript_4338/g.6148  ORF Transcript_4338/g.6148 Transcript_4338/m.6148 type:complete len:215 (+) Transcript_4338:1282-1926(+)
MQRQHAKVVVANYQDKRDHILRAMKKVQALYHNLYQQQRMTRHHHARGLIDLTFLVPKFPAIGEPSQRLPSRQHTVLLMELVVTVPVVIRGSLSFVMIHFHHNESLIYQKLAIAEAVHSNLYQTFLQVRFPLLYRIELMPSHKRVYQHFSVTHLQEGLVRTVEQKIVVWIYEHVYHRQQSFASALRVLCKVIYAPKVVLVVLQPQMIVQHLSPE